jgi:hypothetical protein
MRLLRKRPDQKAGPEAPSAEQAAACLHVTLSPQWGNLSDMGVEAKASSWKCGSCSETFTPDQAKELRANEAERLKQVLGAN